MIPRLGEPPIKNQSYVYRPGAYAILIRGGACLLTHQMAPYPEFQLPGGGIDPGETPLMALYREVMEETGWKISNPRHLGTFRRFVHMPEYKIMAEKICHIFMARPTLKVCDPLEADHRAVWLPKSEAADVLANPGDRLMMKTHVR